MTNEAVDLDFRLEGPDLVESASRYRKLGPGELGDGPLTVSWFCYPTWLRVGNTDVLAVGETLRNVAILGLAMDLPSALHGLRTDSETECAVFGVNARLVMRRFDSQVRLRVVESGIEAVANFDELQLATRRFAHRVATTLREALPEAFRSDTASRWLDWALDAERLDLDWRSGT